MFRVKSFLWATFFVALIIASPLTTPVMAQGRGGLVYHEVRVVDEHGRNVTNISTVTIRLSGTTSAATIYKDAARKLAITQPMTTSSTNTTLSNGTFYWYGPDAWDYTLGDGTQTMTNYGHASFNSSDGRIEFPTFLTAVSSSNYTDAQSATFGTDSDFVLTGGGTANRLTLTPAATDESAIVWFGADTVGVDVEFFAATTGRYMLWDASDEQLEFVTTSITVDGGKIALGDGDHLLFGDTLGTGDFSISDEADVLLIDVVVAGTGEIAIGNDADDVPFTWYGETTGNFIRMTGDQLQVEGAASGAEIALGDGDAILFGDTLGTGDFKLSDETDVLTFDVVAAGTGEMAIGNDADDVPLKWYGETTGDYVYFTSDDLQLEDISLCLGDGTQIQFGDALGTGDMTLSCTTNLLTFGQVVAGTGSIALGVDDAGVDMKMFGDTTAEYLLWDASEDTLSVVGGNVTFTLADAEANQFKVDATGAVAGIAIQLETTNGQINILADGAANGDIALDAEDDITITTASDLTLAVTGVFSAGGTAITNHKAWVETISAAEAVSTADSGKTFVSIGLTGAGAADLVCTLPACAAGLTFTFVDCNATAADDLWITAGAGDAINAGTAAKSFKNTGDVYGAAVIVIGIDADNWIAIPGAIGTWANDNS